MTETVPANRLPTFLCRTATPSIRRIGSVVFLLSLFASNPVSANFCREVTANANVVEVSIDKHRIAGSGVLLTFDGFVVTAAHILVQNIKPPLPLRYFARFAEDEGALPNSWLTATLQRIDKELDLAILKLDEYPSKAPVMMATPSTSPLPEGAKICLSGFGLRKDASGTEIRNGFSTVASELYPNESGYIVPKLKVVDGFSGGAAFHDGQFFGLILGKRIGGGSYVMPGSYIQDFVGPLGVHVSNDGLFTSGVPPQDLRKEVQGNRRSINDNLRQIALILRSMEWDIDVVQEDQMDYKFTVKVKRAFPDQVLDGYLLVNIKVYFDHDEFRQRLERNGEVYEAVLGAKVDGVEEIDLDGVSDELSKLMARYYAEGLDLEDTPVSKFVVTLTINHKGSSRELFTKELKP